MGLGEEFVRQLAAQHARVAFVDIDAANGTALEHELTNAGHVVRFARADVRDIPRSPTGHHIGRDFARPDPSSGQQRRG